MDKWYFKAKTDLYYSEVFKFRYVLLVFNFKQKFTICVILVILILKNFNNYKNYNRYFLFVIIIYIHTVVVLSTPTFNHLNLKKFENVFKYCKTWHMSVDVCFSKVHVPMILKNETINNYFTGYK